MSALRSVLRLSMVVAIGCGGATSTNAVGEGGTPNGVGSPGEEDGSLPSDSSVGLTDDASVGVGDDSSTPVGDDSGLATIGPDGGLVSPPPMDDDAGTTGTVDGSPGRPGGGVTTPPRGTDGGPDQTECAGTTACDSKTQVCCIATRSCIAANAECRGGDSLSCSGTNSCASGVCCQEATGRTTYTSKCEPKCPAGAQQLCTTDTDCTGTNQICVRNGDYGVCEAPRMPPVPPPIRDGGIILPIPPVRDGGPLRP